MDTLEQQVTLLNHKVDTLYEVIREMNLKLSDTSNSQDSSTTIETLIPKLEQPINDIAFSPPPQKQNRFEHKDVLIDDSYTETNFVIHREEPSITADIQIQRLTAQLTAAYNRIAALEERLLSQRPSTSSKI
ncbi:MAG: hypothetical protein WBA13_20455 [Microcoleaceae cyanobacterium]